MNEQQDDFFRKKIPVLVFQSSGVLFAFRVSDVKEILHMAELSVPPGMPSFLKGFLNLEGFMLPVLSISILLGLAEIPSGLYTPLIIIKLQGQLAAVVVDHVLETASYPSGEVLPLKDRNTFNNCVDAIISNTIYLLSCDKILLEQEKTCILEFEKITNNRIAGLGKTD